MVEQDAPPGLVPDDPSVPEQRVLASRMVRSAPELPSQRQRAKTTVPGLYTRLQAFQSPQRVLSHIDLQACTVWVGQVPMGLATEPGLRAALESQFGKKVKTITLRVKPPSEAGGRNDKSWAFVTFTDPGTVAAALERTVVVCADGNGGEAQLIISAPSDTVGRGHGTMAGVAVKHRARGRWGAAGATAAKEKAARAERGLMAMWEEHHEQQRAQGRRCFLLPHSKVRLVWDGLRIFVLLYVALVYPARQAFDAYPRFGSGMFWFEALIDLWFLADIVLEFRTAYTGNDGILVVNPLRIRRRYLRGWFCCDLVSSLPIHYVVTLIQEGEDGTGSSQGLKLLKVLRLVRLARLMRIARFSALSHEHEHSPMMYDFIEPLRLCHSAFVVVWIAHVCACLWYFLGTIDADVGLVDGGVHTVRGWVNAYRDANAACNRTESSIYEYFTAFHAVNPKMYDLVDHVGAAGEFTTPMLIGAILLETLGLVIFGAVVGSLTSMLADKPGDLAYRTKMDELREFFKKKHLPGDLRRNVRMFYDNLYQKKSVFDEQAIMRPLPPQLAKDMVHALYSDLIASSRMFVGLEEDCIAKLCMSFSPFHVSAATKIAREGHICREVYLIEHGEVMVSRGDSPVAVISRGDTFGEMSALGHALGPKGNHRDKTATALTDTDMVFITGTRLKELFEDFDSLMQAFEQTIAKRFQQRSASSAAEAVHNVKITELNRGDSGDSVESVDSSPGLGTVYEHRKYRKQSFKGPSPAPPADQQPHNSGATRLEPLGLGFRKQPTSHDSSPPGSPSTPVLGIPTPRGTTTPLSSDGSRRRGSVPDVMEALAQVQSALDVVRSRMDQMVSTEEDISDRMEIIEKQLGEITQKQ